AAANCSAKRTSPTGRNRSSDQAIEPAISSAASALCALLEAAWAVRATKALAAPYTGFFKVLYGARMMRQRRLQLAGLGLVEAVEVRVPGGEILLVLAHGLDELVDHVVGHVRADADHHVDGLHGRGLVDAGDVRRGVDCRVVVLAAHRLHALLRVRQRV